MKKELSTLLLSVSLVCCQKQPEITVVSSDLKDHVYALLKDSMLVNDFERLQWPAATLVSVPDDGIKVLRIPIDIKRNVNEFVLISLKKENVIVDSRIIKVTENRDNDGNALVRFNGKIEFATLQRTLLRKTRIINGYFEDEVQVSSTSMQSRGESLASPPNVVVTSQPYKANTSVWMSTYSLTGTSQVQKAVSYISVTGEPVYAVGGGIRTDVPIVVDFEPPIEDLKAINVQEFINCFNMLPDAGSTCSIELLADIPVDTNPNLLFNWSNSSPGHVFLQIKKINGSKTVMQNIGFYPIDGWKTMLTPAPVAGKFVDNSQHEYNAGYIQKLTPEQLKTVLTHISYLARFVKYDIDEFNCTDFALSVFNQVRLSNEFIIPKYDLPGGAAPFGTSTPQGVFNKLQSMKQAGTDVANINIPGVKGWVANSNGPCK